MSKRNIINFVEKDVKEYLDNAIMCWRKERDDMSKSKEERLIAICYIDAFQSVRMSLFDEQYEAVKRIFSKG